jgi:tetratricopeptide (TPR) repeat protein
MFCYTIENYQKSIKYFEEVEVSFLLGGAWTGLGLGYYLLGDSETAIKHAEKGINILTESGSTSQLVIPFKYTQHN